MFDRYRDVLEGLERQLLSREVPPSHVTAGRQLEQAKIAYSRIIAVNPEAILFLDEQDKPVTAWSEVRDDGKTLVFYRQMGFPAWPSPYLKDTG